jgi:dTDP-4-dehydrorhamnose reductase
MGSIETLQRHLPADKLQTGECVGERPKIAVVGFGRVGRGFLHDGLNADITAVTRSKQPLPESGKLSAHLNGVDIARDYEGLVRTLEKLKVDGVRTVINAAGEADIDKLELQRYAADRESLSAYQTNVVGAENLARACKETDLKLLHISTESVFGQDKKDGAKYHEDEIPNPSTRY